MKKRNLGYSTFDFEMMLCNAIEKGKEKEKKGRVKI